ncbi:MAG: flagellar motor protein [Agitococcus sp.]|nr:flagellar motor protein [Agitococcus sp.]
MYMTIIGLGLALGAVLLSQVMEGASLQAMYQPTALLIVSGGTMGAVIAQSSAKDFWQAVQMLKWLIVPPISGRTDYLNEIVKWSQIAHRDGSLKLDELISAIEDPMLKSGVEMIVDRYEPDYIRDTLLMDVRIRDARLKGAAKMWEAAGGYAPTIGILGSVLGLLQVMGSFQDPAKLTAGVAVSFVATVYGLAFANLLFLPIAARLRSIIFELTLRDELRIEGLTMIALNKQTRLVERTLNAIAGKAENVVQLKRRTV